MKIEKDFDLKKYLKEGKLYEEIGKFQIGDKVEFIPQKMADFGFEDDIEYYEDLTGVITKTYNSDLMDDGEYTDVIEIKLSKPIQPPGGYEEGGMEDLTLVKSQGDFSMVKKYLKEGKLREEFETDDMMSDEEVKEEVLSLISQLRHTTNEWATRDTLKNFTEFGFWSGQEMASIDIEMADDIAFELYDFVEGLPPGHPDIDEVYKRL